MFNIDTKDKKILYQLDRNSRQSLTQIGKKVGLSKQVVLYRINKLQELKVIEYFYVKTNPSILGYMHFKIFLRLHNITKDKEDELLKDLKQNNVYWLSSIRGKFDIVLSIYVKNIGDFSQKYQQLLGKWGEFLLERNVTIHEKACIYSKAYLLSYQRPEETIYGKWKEESVYLDNIDIALLRFLNTNARAPIIDIAKDLNLSSDIIHYRIKNLQKKGVITGFGTKIDFRKLNNNYYIIPLKLQNMNQEKYKKLEILAKNNKNVIYFIRSIGNHDAELEIETANKEELDKLINSLRDCFVTEIKDYEILEVIREHRINYFPF